ncbi:MAG: LysE family translocator [Ilumatobacteraceae bacterium]
MPSASLLLTFAAASFVLLIIPGPAVLYIVNRSVSDGRRVGLSAAAGLTLGNLTHAIAASVGLSAVLAASATAFNIVKWAGAAYLIVTGLRSLATRHDVVDPDQQHMSPRRAFTQGIVVNTLNPKVALFFVSYLPAFIDTDRTAWSQALVLGLVFVLLGFCTDSTYSLIASGLRDRLLRGRALPFVRRYVSGSVFVLLGVLAARTSASHT